LSQLQKHSESQAQLEAEISKIKKEHEQSLLESNDSSNAYKKKLATAKQLNEELVSKLSKNEDLVAEISKVRHEIEEKFHKSVEEKTALKQSVEKLETELHDKDQEIKTYHENASVQTQEFATKYENERQKVAELGETLSKFSLEKQELLLKCERLEEQHQETRNKLAEEGSLLEEEVKVLREVKEKYEELKIQQEESIGKVKDFEEQIENKQKTAGKLYKAFMEMRVKVEGMAVVLGQATKEAAAAQTSLAEMVPRQEYQTVIEKMKQVVAKYRQLQEVAKQKESQVQQLNGQLETSSAQCKDLVSNKVKLEEELLRRDQESASFQQEMETLRRAVSGIEEEKKQFLATQESLKALEQQLSDTIAREKELHDKNNDLQTKLGTLNSEAQNMQRILEEEKKLAHQKEQDLLEELQEKRTLVEKLGETSEESARQLEKNLEETEEKLVEYREQATEFHNKLKASQEALTNKKQEADALQTKLTGTETRLSEITKKMRELVAKHKDLVAEHKRLKEESSGQKEVYQLSIEEYQKKTDELEQTLAEGIDERRDMKDKLNFAKQSLGVFQLSLLLQEKTLRPTGKFFRKWHSSVRHMSFDQKYEEAKQQSLSCEDQISVLNAQLKSFQDLTDELNKGMEERKGQNEELSKQLEEKLSLKDQLEKEVLYYRQRAVLPREIQVEGRVTFGEQTWCLISFEISDKTPVQKSRNAFPATDSKSQPDSTADAKDSDDEQDSDHEDGTKKSGANDLSSAEPKEIVREWRCQQEIVQHLAKTSQAVFGSELDPADLEEAEKGLPSSIQQQHAEEIERLKAGFEDKLKKVEEELAGSTQAFSVYRNRAHTALQKTAAQQQDSEKKIEELEALLKKAKEEHEARVEEQKQIVLETEQKLKEVSGHLEAARKEVEELQMQASTSEVKLKEKYESEKEADRQALELAKQNSEQNIVKLGEMSKALKDLGQELERTKKDARAKSNLARKIIEDKEAEIRQLRSSSPSQADTPETNDEEGAGPVNTEAASPALGMQKKPTSFKGRGGREMDRAEQSILQMARLQSQREAETARLKQQLQELTKSLQEKETVLETQRKATADKEERIEALQREVARERDLNSGENAHDKLTYLKNVILRYMSCSPASTAERQALISVISTILSFNPDELHQVESASSAWDNPAWASFNSLFSPKK